MEESDALLVNNLKEFISVPESIKTIRDIQTNQIHGITCSVFQMLGIDTKELKQISGTQKFRAMSKLVQSLNKELDTKYELNDIMNPTVSFVRRLVLTLINKLGSTEAEKSKINKNIPEQNKKILQQRKILKNWLNQEYIIPQLQEDKIVPYNPHRLKFTLNKDFMKKNLYSQMICTPGNAHVILRQSFIQEQIQRKKREAEEGINRKENQQKQRLVHEIVKSNRKQWEEASKKMKKIKKKIIEKQQVKQEEKTEPASVFQQQVEQITEEKKKINKIVSQVQKTTTTESFQPEADVEDPLERLKQECQRKKLQLNDKLNQVVAILNQKKQKIQNDTELKQKLQEQIIQYEQRTQQQKQDRTILKKQVEKLKIIQNAVEGEKDLGGEVKQLEEEVKFLEKQANRQINDLQSEIKKIKTQSNQKIQILTDLKTKLNKIQTQYHEICEQIAQKQQIKTKVKIGQSGTNRIYYSKRISEMESRWRQTQKEIKKVKQDMENLREETRRSIVFSERAQTQLQNMAASSRFRTDNENIQFIDIITKCKTSFKRTVTALNLINQTKSQIQQYESKVHSLAGKNYPRNIQKVKQALEDLRKQINAIKQIKK